MENIDFRLTLATHAVGTVAGAFLGSWLAGRLDAVVLALVLVLR